MKASKIISCPFCNTFLESSNWVGLTGRKCNCCKRFEIAYDKEDNIHVISYVFGKEMISISYEKWNWVCILDNEGYNQKVLIEDARFEIRDPYDIKYVEDKYRILRLFS